VKKVALDVLTCVVVKIPPPRPESLDARYCRALVQIGRAAAYDVRGALEIPYDTFCARRLHPLHDRLLRPAADVGSAYPTSARTGSETRAPEQPARGQLTPASTTGSPAKPAAELGEPH
jgi:hypothetical protein